MLVGAFACAHTPQLLARPSTEDRDLVLRVHAARVGGEAGEGRDRLEVRERIGQVVLARPDRAEADGTREPHLLDVLAKANGLRLLRPMLDGEAQAEPHSGSLQTRPAGGSSVRLNCGRAM